MRAAGLLALLAGSIILMLPVFSQLLHHSWAVADDSLIGGALLCLGIAAVMDRLDSVTFGVIVFVVIGILHAGLGNVPTGFLYW